jgi:hypothetical protein
MSYAYRSIHWTSDGSHALCAPHRYIKDRRILTGRRSAVECKECMRLLDFNPFGTTLLSDILKDLEGEWEAWDGYS